ncbi:MAG: PQQ-dependent sugar dehydrogenase [Pseudomonadota bacterium]
MLRIVVALLIVGLVGVAAFAFGYISGDAESSEIRRLLTKVERNLNEIRGLPTSEEQAVAQFESTFIRFRGELYPLPDSHFENGGGLTIWDGSLLLVDRRGSVFRFVDGEGLVRTAIETPEHGDDAYSAFAARPENADRRHRPDKLRYNDIMFVENEAFRGLVVSYNFFDPDRVCYGNRLAKLPVGPDALPEAFQANASDWEVFFDAQPCLNFRPGGTAIEALQAGGRMDMHPDGRLILASGDFALDGITAPDIGLMDPDVHYGKILAVDISTGEAEAISVGHRNVQGVAVDVNGEIWSVEHGVRGGDELNHIAKGENHGWPREGLGTLYSGQPLPFEGPPGRHDVYDKPAFAWLPSAATSALESIDNFHPAWDGGLLVGSLSSPRFGQSLFHVRTEGERVVFVERIRLDRRVRYVQQFGDRLALWLDPTDLLILEQVARFDPVQVAMAVLNENHPDVADQVSATLKSCNECHSYEERVHLAGPSLNGVVGRSVAATSFEGYSEGLMAFGGTWTEARLAEYLVDPAAVVPGTSMPAMGLQEGPALDALIDALKSMDSLNFEHLTY